MAEAVSAAAAGPVARSGPAYPSSIFAIASASFGTTIGTIAEPRLDRTAFGILQLAGVIAVNVVRILQHVARQHRDHIVVRSNHSRRGQLSNSRQRRRRGRLAADAASPDDRLGVRDLLLGHFFHHAAGDRTSCSALGHETGSPMRIAVASVSGSATAWNSPLRLHEIVERRRAFRLNHRQPRHLPDEAELAQFAQRLSERRRVAEIAARQHDPIRRIPIALVQHFEDDRLLPFDAKRIDGIEQVNAQPLGQHAHQRQNLIEVRLHLQRPRAIFQRLRQLAEGNIAVRNEDDGIQPRRARVGRHGCRSVAGGNAGHALHVQPDGLRDAARHAVVLERSGRIEALMLEREPIESAVAAARGASSSGVLPSRSDTTDDDGHRTAAARDSARRRSDRAVVGRAPVRQVCFNAGASTRSSVKTTSSKPPTAGQL